MKLAILFTTIISFYSLAESSNGLSKHEKTLMDQYYASIEALGDVSTKCSSHNAPILPKNLFDDVLLTKKEVAVVLSFFYSKAKLKCEEKAELAYYRNSILLRSIAKSKKGIESLNASDELVSMNYAQYLKDKSEYLALSLELRNKVEQLEELQSLFQPFASLELLETNLKNM